MNKKVKYSGFFLCHKCKVTGKSVSAKEEDTYFGRYVDGKYVPPANPPKCPKCGIGMSYHCYAIQGAIDKTFRV